MDRNIGISGMEDLLEHLPKEKQNWFCFGHILKFECKELFDYENWGNYYNAELLLSDDSEVYKIRLLLKHISGQISICIARDITGLTIRNMENRDPEPGHRFRVYDFEEDTISIYCEAIEVSLL